jgi:U3 small nucleolar RNA-associated protein 20
MATLYRCVNDDDVIVKKQYGDKVGDEDEVRTLANEVLDMIKTKIGADVFLESYNSVRAGVLAQRHERKQARSIMAVVDPEAYAKRKVQQNLGKRDKRRKRNEGYGEGRIRGGERIKRRRVEE